MKKIVVCFIVLFSLSLNLFSQEETEKLINSKLWNFKCKVKEIKVYKITQIYLDPIFIKVLITNNVLNTSFPMAVICSTETGEEYHFTMTCNIQELKLYRRQ